MLESSIHSSIIESESNDKYHYLIQAQDSGAFTTYLYSLKDSSSAYKTDISPALLQSIAVTCDKDTEWVKNALYQTEKDVLWNIQANKGSAQVTWKEKAANGMRLKLAELIMEAHSHAPSAMLSICAKALQEADVRNTKLQDQCEELKKENMQLQEIADQAVEARELLENDLVTKFARLLNEKKQKIRGLRELLDEHQAAEIARAPDGEEARRPAPADRPASAAAVPAAAGDDADDPSDAGSAGDAYDRDTDVDAKFESGDAASADAYDQDTEEEDGGGRPARAGAAPDSDSLELDCAELDGPVPARRKRAVPDAPEPPENKRRPGPADSDDLLDIV